MRARLMYRIHRCWHIAVANPLLPEQPMSGKRKPDIQGEGNYDASRQYKVATKKFIEAGKVERAARDAAPRSDAEAAGMLETVQNGKAKARKRPCANSEGRGIASHCPYRVFASSAAIRDE